uniref:Uncharacterized protein n=1 Tax=Cryptococcus bacillisporus CA1280 TaxID=1296109 RepID=A0A0D0TE99_CRYGA|nr:hypothetical protein I312_06030 [Cryptococcus bacillisporus CA1280]
MSVRLLCALGEKGSPRAGTGGLAGWDVDSNPVVDFTLKGLEICLVEEPIGVFEVLLGVKPDLKPVVEVTPTGLEMSSFLTWSFLGGIVTVDSLTRSPMAKVPAQLDNIINEAGVAIVKFGSSRRMQSAGEIKGGKRSNCCESGEKRNNLSPPKKDTVVTCLDSVIDDIAEG